MSGITTEQIETELLDEFYITEQSHLMKPFLDFDNCTFPKFGHVGTLDPFAMGSLAMPFGKLTKIQEMVNTMTKIYHGSFKIGKKTVSADWTGKVISENSEKLPEIETLRTAIENEFIGKVLINPPILSALKINGRTSYSVHAKDLNSADVEYISDYLKNNKLKAREHEIFSFELNQVNNDEYNFKVNCSKGTYIRSLIESFCERFGCLGYLTELERYTEYLSKEKPFIYFTDKQVLDSISIPIQIEGRGKNDYSRLQKYLNDTSLKQILRQVILDINIGRNEDFNFSKEFVEAMLTQPDVKYNRFNYNDLIDDQLYTLYIRDVQFERELKSIWKHGSDGLSLIFNCLSLLKTSGVGFEEGMAKKEKKGKGKVQAPTSQSRPHALTQLPQNVVNFLKKDNNVDKIVAENELNLNQSSPQASISICRFIFESIGKGKSDPVNKLQENLLLDIIGLAAIKSLDLQKVYEKIDLHLQGSHFMTGVELSLADFALYSLLMSERSGLRFVSIGRWLKSFSSLTDLGLVSAKSKTKVKKKGGKKEVAVCPPLVNADELKEIVTRFPPEPSGHLHIGHCKALFLNEYYAKRYNGKMLLRFDDTNPATEKAEFEEAIRKDVERLGIDIASISHTSDHFELIHDCAVKLIKQGDAYMDNTDVQLMREERDKGIDSKHRNNSVETNMKYWNEMLTGSTEGKSFCLRAKMDMQSPNKCLRDPVFFRCNDLPHPKTGIKYKAYPTYDLACPIVDSIEGVTHAMRDMNYKDRNPLYNWVIEKLKLRKVYFQDFAKMNFVYTVMSKRKLKWLVNEGIAKGWDDPRFPTVKGILRRGVQIDALRDFMISQGASRKVCDIEWDKFWNVNKKVIDPKVPRYMAIDGNENIKVKIIDVGDSALTKVVSKHPKDKNGELYGNKTLYLTKDIYLEKEDIKDVKLNEVILLLQWGVVEIVSLSPLEAKLRDDVKVSVPERKIHWLPSTNIVKGIIYEFDHLITKPILEADDDFKDFANTNSWAETEVILDENVGRMETNECLQLLRRGYYRIDRHDEKGVHLFTIPDGKAKAMSTFSTKSSKMAHR